MMMHTRLLSGLLLSLAFVPSTALAYVSPEEVISQDSNNTRFVPPPPLNTSDAVDAQQKKSADRRAAEQAKIIGNGLSQDETATEEETTHEAAPAMDGDLNEFLQKLNAKLDAEEAEKAANEEARKNQDARILERLRANQELSGDSTVYVPSQESLHSGAPLADTGMSTGVATLLAMLAVGSVVTWVVRLEKKN